MLGKRPLTSTVPESSHPSAGRGAAGSAGKATQVQQIATPPGAAPAAQPDQVHAAAAHGVAGPGQALPHIDRIQQSFGRHDVSGIQAHVGGAAAEGAGAMGAQAYATGDHVAFAGAPDLHTAAHEAAHVVQQAKGVSLKGGVGQAGDAHEQHADAVADAVVRGESAEGLLGAPGGAAGGASGVQRSVVQRRDNNGPYAGNRPDPASATTPTYTIRSNASRVLQVGTAVEFHIDQVQAAVSAAGSQLNVRWQVINDPAAVAAGTVKPTLDGPQDQRTWRLYAQIAGVHTIKAWVSMAGNPLGELTYSQQVVSKAGPVSVPANAARSPLSTMADFIALVRRIETAYRGVPWQDVVSRIRKEYYPGPGGGPYSGIKASFTWDDLIDEQQDLPGLEVPPVAMGDVAAVRHTPVVSTTDGKSIDIGHILTGVDSFNFPGVAGIFANHGTEGPAAATWSGDVGSALVEWANGAPHSDTSAATRLKYYDQFAGNDDMLGDVDALAVAHGPNVNLPATAPLSQRLEAFYQTAPATGGHNQRFHAFCRASHFTLAGNQLDAAAVARIRDQIKRFSDAYNVKGTITDAMILGGGGSPPSPSAIKETTMARISDQLGWFSSHFIQWVNAGLAAEGGS